MGQSLGKALRGKEPAQSTSQPLETGHHGTTFFNFKTLTPRRVKWILQRADAHGRIDSLYMLYNDMENTDTRYGALTGQLRSTVANMPMRIQRQESRTSQEEELAKEYAEYGREIMRRLDVKSLTKKFVDKYIRGAKLFSLEWDMVDLPYGRKMYVPTELEDVEDIYLVEHRQNHDDDTYGEVAVKLKDRGRRVPVSELPFDNHLFLGHDNKGRYAEAGIARKALPWYLGLRFVQSWWVQYIENYGQPTRVGSYSRTSKQSERNNLKRFLKNVGKNRYGMFPDGMDVKFVKADDTGGIRTYADFLNKGHAEYSILILGQPGTTGDSGGDGDMAGIREDIAQDVSHDTTQAWQNLIKKGLRLNYGDDYREDLCPDVEAIVLSGKEAREKARAAQIVSQMGVPVPESYIYRSVLGSEEPHEGEAAVMHNQRFIFGEDDMPEPGQAEAGIQSQQGGINNEAGEDGEIDGDQPAEDAASAPSGNAPPPSEEENE